MTYIDKCLKLLLIYIVVCGAIFLLGTIGIIIFVSMAHAIVWLLVGLAFIIPAFILFSICMTIKRVKNLNDDNSRTKDN